ncbi:hypothetical protein GGR53DRAFT_469520 [Hypoxylon sp. FL1150]|nr:hypothetical protein GGR53DRAFT_469520 [Hypoxylon sp. FL1150]
METNYSTTLNAVPWVLGSLVIIVCTVRLWGRVYVLHQTGWDDFFMVLGALSAIVSSALVTVAVSHGLGRHQSDIKDLHDLSEAMKYTILAPVISIISSSSSKISIFIFLLRLMGMTAKRWHIYFLWGVCILMVVINIVAITLMCLSCDPTAPQDEKSLDVLCQNPTIQVYGGTIQAAYNALVDVILAVFPMTFITRLNISRRMKIGLCFMMGGSVVATAATIAKAYLRKNVANHQDITWFWAPVTLLYTVEMDVIIIVGTIPSLWPLLKLARRMDSSSYGPYKNASCNPTHGQGSEAYQLDDSKNSRVRQGPITRALQELDDLQTVRTISDNRWS